MAKPVERAKAIEMRAQGATAKEIASRLKVNEATVRRWTKKAYEKRLNELQAKAKELALAGVRPNSIASQLGVSERTVYGWAREQLAIAKREHDARRRRGS